MTQCIGQISLGILRCKRVTGVFDGGDISSDGGLALLGEADRRLGLTRQLTHSLTDRRQASKVQHQLHELVAQRVYQIAAGYEDCNDADRLRYDPMLKVAVGRLPQTGAALASQPTLSRFENNVGRTQLRRMAEVLPAIFFAENAVAKPRQIILDFDATDDETHGQQQFAEFHGYYDEHCYLPLLVTGQLDGGPQELLVAMLRRGRSHAATHALAVLKRLVARLRARWPWAQIILRADSGFALPELYAWCEANGVDYLIGLAKNSRLLALIAPQLALARREHAATGEKARQIRAGRYVAGTWPHKRRVLMKAEVTAKGDNPRFVVTSLAGDAGALYELYAARGEMENRIKELKRDLQMDRTSCHRFVANQFRVLLCAAAFVLLSFLRKRLAGTGLERARVCTLQRDLLKLGVRVKETARRVWLQFASSCPVQELWPLLLARLRASPA